MDEGQEDIRHRSAFFVVAEYLADSSKDLLGEFLLHQLSDLELLPPAQRIGQHDLCV